MFTLRTLLASLLFVFMSMGSAFAQSIATVDFQRAINESKKGAAAQAQLEAIFKEKQDAIAAMEQELMTKQEEYQKQAMGLTDTARAAKEQELMQLQGVYQQTAYSAEAEMQQTYGQLMEGLIVELQGVHVVLFRTHIVHHVHQGRRTLPCGRVVPRAGRGNSPA